MTVLTRDLLDASPLADLHTLASELAIDGFRRLRREDLIERISERRGDGEQPAGRRRRRGGRNGDAEPASSDEGEERTSRRRRRNGDEATDNGRGRNRGRGQADQPEQGGTAEGPIAIGASGSALLTTADGTEIYVSAGQIRRCGLVDGDRVAGPTRPPRNSERYASLVRVEAINGTAADEAAPAPKTESQIAVHPSQLFALESDDPTVAAIAWLTPLGRGSRAVITGPSTAGKSEALRRLGAALRATDGVELFTVLAGVRPEEVGDWRADGLEPTVALDLASGPEQRTKAIDDVVDQGRRIAARGGHAVLLIDTLDGLADGAARRVLAAARALQDGGTLTIIATRETAVGGESTVVSLDRALTSIARFPAIDLAHSGTMRPELLVGEEGAAAIAAARAELR